MFEEDKKNYTLREASYYSGVKVRTLRDWIVKGKINAFKYSAGRMWFIPQREIERLKRK